MNDNSEIFLEQVKRKYKLEVYETKGNSQFIARTVRFSDPRKLGLNIELTFNKEGEISTFDTDLFKFSRVNIAEGYSQEELQGIVEQTLEGKSKIKRGVFFATIELSCGKEKVNGRAALLLHRNDHRLSIERVIAYELS